MHRIPLLLALLPALLMPFAPAAPAAAEAPAAPAASPAAVGTWGLANGSFTSATTISATMFDQTGTITVGSIQLTVIGRFVTGTGTTPLGTPTVLRGYNTGPGPVGRILAAAAYPNTTDIHIFELRWDASGNVNGGWQLYP